LFRHFAAAAEAAGKPVILYNIPSRTAVDLLPATVAAAHAISTDRRAEEGVAGVDRVRELLSVVRAGFTILSGDDATSRQVLLAGARGVISVTANVAPRAMSEMVNAAIGGDRTRAESLDAPLAALHRICFSKRTLFRRMGARAHGIDPGRIRLPLTRWRRVTTPRCRALRTVGP